MNIDEALSTMFKQCDRVIRERGIDETIREHGVSMNVDYIMGYGLGMLSDEPLDTSIANTDAYKEGHAAGTAAGELMDESYDYGDTEEEQELLRRELIAKARARAVELL